MRSAELRAMSVGEILDAAGFLYRKSFTTLVSISIACLGVPVLLQLYAELSGAGLGIRFLALVLWSLGAVFSSAATLRVVSDTYLGRPVSTGDALNDAFGKVGTLFVASLGVGFLAMLGLIFLIVPGIIVMCGMSVVSQVVVVENVGAEAAMRRSWELTKGFRAKALSLGLMTFLIVVLPTIVIAALSGILPGGETTATALGDFVSLVVSPFGAATFALYYYDLRVRKEAFDIEMLSAQLGQPAPVVA